MHSTNFFKKSKHVCEAIIEYIKNKELYFGILLESEKNMYNNYISKNIFGEANNGFTWGTWKESGHGKFNDIKEGDVIRMEYEYDKELKFSIIHVRTGESLNLISTSYGISEENVYFHICTKKSDA